jgi:hypothetical protein
LARGRCGVELRKVEPLNVCQVGPNHAVEPGTGLAAESLQPIDQAKAAAADCIGGPAGGDRMQPGNEFVFDDDDLHGISDFRFQIGDFRFQLELLLRIRAWHNARVYVAAKARAN